MGLLNKIKKTINRADKQITGGRLTREINNGSKAVAPLAKPVLTVLGAVIAGPAGAAAGAAIGEPTGNVLATGRLQAPPVQVDLDLTLHVQGAPGEGGASLSEYDPSQGGSVANVYPANGSAPLAASPVADDLEESWSELIGSALSRLFSGMSSVIRSGLTLDRPSDVTGTARSFPNASTAVRNGAAPLAVAPDEANYVVNSHGIAVLDSYAYGAHVSGFNPDGTPFLDKSAIRRK